MARLNSAARRLPQRPQTPARCNDVEHNVVHKPPTSPPPKRAYATGDHGIGTKILLFIV